MHCGAGGDSSAPSESPRPNSTCSISSVKKPEGMSQRELSDLLVVDRSMSPSFSAGWTNTDGFAVTMCPATAAPIASA